MKKQILLGLFGVVFVCLIPVLWIMGVALYPYVGVIGLGLTMTMFVGMCCLCMLMIAFTVQKVKMWGIKRGHEYAGQRLFVAGEVVVYRGENGEFVHLSAEHWKARALAAPVVEGVQYQGTTPYRVEDVLELWQKGSTVDTIAKAYRVHRDEIEAIVRGSK